MDPEKGVFNLLLPFLLLRVCTSTDTITPNQSIKDGDLLVSNGETFALGFFSPENSNRRYVGIWYNKISEQTVVWVANREKPINGPSGVLFLNQDGNLAIYDNSQNITHWDTNLSVAETGTNTSTFYSARLMDSGNFVLFQGDTVSDVVWQSFDHPTNTMLPHMKLGLDLRTGLDRILTSWKSRDDPGVGQYSYRVEPSGSPQLVLYNGSVRVWRSTPVWIENEMSGSPNTTYWFLFNASYIDNQDEVSTVYTLINNSIASTKFVDESGSIQMVSWLGRWVRFYSVPEDQCDNYRRCGVYGDCDSNNGREFECTCLPGYEPRSTDEWYLQDASGGCVKKRQALAMCGNGDGFVKIAKAKMPDTSKALVWKNLSMQECKEKCLRNCSCTAYVVGGRGICITWYGNLMDVRRFPDGGQDLYVRVDAIELAQYLKKSRSLNGKKVAILVASVVLTSFLIISFVCWLVMKKRRKYGGFDNQDNDQENIELTIFEIDSIARATNNFSDTYKIGEGGFGSVYKGQLSIGKESKDIAVKRLSKNSTQGLKEFKNEVILIAKLQHRNLVRLLGCCIHGEERILVYEYMPNGSLDSSIFGLERAQNKLLTWRMRLDIIMGIARGVLYLHQDSRLRIIHRDLKASNILLDSEMNPKISDFGLARAFEGDHCSEKTKRVIGTYGYMSPEYAIDGLFSTKSDVFSFGVIVLEIISGKKNRQFQHPDHDLNLLGHAWNLWTKGKASELLDSLMEHSSPMSNVLRCIQIGLLCVQKCPEDRPSMSSVVLMFVSESVMLPQPQQPGFHTERSSKETHDRSPAQTQSSSSINEVTMTQLEAR
ncbi:G-type lectin S-receptor-like serine/threonine-protein kinase RKS1 isoform X2 [Rhododendron vialii]|uniref:G-type lectin S-receptor-like serine/threonine-protein kinase RKS1 isoform X2 n=1 Tax=Rhododendron vialii TaxID=182163 RepID=UPI00265D82E3|nr:G-type lectin S-receptor-like serine/threonine-protein kinase RKS1 isoform X2 [Rhododendron vialii]